MKAKILSALYSIHNYQPNFDPKHGICLNVVRAHRLATIPAMGEMEKSFPSWEYFSGNVAFPISVEPESDSALDRMLEFKKAGDKGRLWDRSTLYGARRYQLVDHMIEHFGAQVSPNMWAYLSNTNVPISEVLDILKGLKSHPLLDMYKFGICNAFSDIELDPAALNHVFKQWEHFSGDFPYPVPSPIESMTPEQYYWDAKKTRTGMWGDNKYGQLRRNLLDFMIDYFEKLNEEFEQNA